MKKIIQVMFALGLAVMLCANADVSEAATPASGTNWTFSIDGTLSITGSGTMATDWCRTVTLTDIKKVEVGSSITKIPFCSFLGCDNIEEMTIPFVGSGTAVNLLTDAIELPGQPITESGPIGEGKSVYTHLGYLFGADSAEDNATYVPTSLKKVTVTGSKIGEGAFKGCAKITQIDLSLIVSEIGANAFDGCIALTNFYIPSSVTNIGSKAFNGCTGLEQITFYGSAPTIAADAFTGIIVDVNYQGNSSWNSVIDKNYGGTSVNWVNQNINDPAKFETATLNVGQDLKLKFYITETLDASKLALRATDLATHAIKYGVVATEFCYLQVTPVNIAHLYKLELVYNNEYVLDTIESYGVVKYCNKTAAAYPSNKKLLTLLADIMNYGAATQEYEGNYSVPLQNNQEWIAQNQSTYTNLDVQRIKEGNEDLITRVSTVGLNLTDVVKVRFVIAASDTTNVTAKLIRIRNNEETVVDENIVITNDNYEILTKSIYATEFSDLYRLELSRNGEVVTKYTYGIATYITNNQNSENTAKAKLCKMLWLYGKSSEAYVK